jgi:hypothetical protein
MGAPEVCGVQNIINRQDSRLPVVASPSPLGAEWHLKQRVRLNEIRHITSIQAPCRATHEVFPYHFGSGCDLLFRRPPVTLNERHLCWAIAAEYERNAPAI